LVYQSKEEAQEAFRGHAICGCGSKPSTLLHEKCSWQSLSHGSLPHNALKKSFGACVL